MAIKSSKAIQGYKLEDVLKQNIILIFPDGVGIRNYLYSDVFKSVDADITILHSFDNETEKLLASNSDVKKFYRIPKYVESVKEKFLRELICLCRLKYNAKIADNPTILTNWNTKQKGFVNKVFYTLITQASRLFPSYNQILKLEKAYQKSLRKNSFYHEIEALFVESKPTSIFCSHQRALICATIFAVAEDQKIKSTTVIYSWDNIPKARLALKADQYLVWSQYMKDELHFFYPEIVDQKIIITGTPQFDFYNDASNIIEKASFYREYNLDVSKKIICFSGDDVKTSPDDPQYLHDLASEICRNNLHHEYQILLRRCPVDFSGRFDSVINSFPDLIKVATPLWSCTLGSAWSTIFPLPEDIKLLVSTVYYSDVVVNLGSTMALDFAMFKKPCVFIAYDQPKKVDASWSAEYIYNFQHFRSMPGAEAVLWWKKKEDISSLIINANYTDSVQKWKNIVLGEEILSSNYIAKALNL